MIKESQKCNICPRECNINRKVSIGYCGVKELKIAKVMRHIWEEPCISGSKGTGAIFFSGCPLKCSYCQNYSISAKAQGKKITIRQLADIFKKIDESDLNTISLISPTQFTDQIIEALNIYHPKIPVVWNTGGYEKEDTIAKLKGIADVFLCDIKYFSASLSQNLSKAEDYFEYCSKAVLKMRETVKDTIKDGIMTQGLLIRHLVLPDQIKDSIDILNWIYSNLGNKTCLSLMSQYTPLADSKGFLARKLKPIEYKIVVREAQRLGFKNGYIQSCTSSSSDYTPDFSPEKLYEL